MVGGERDSGKNREERESVCVSGWVGRWSVRFGKRERERERKRKIIGIH